MLSWMISSCFVVLHWNWMHRVRIAFTVYNDPIMALAARLELISRSRRWPKSGAVEVGRSQVGSVRNRRSRTSRGRPSRSLSSLMSVMQSPSCPRDPTESCAPDRPSPTRRDGHRIWRLSFSCRSSSSERRSASAFWSQTPSVFLTSSNRPLQGPVTFEDRSAHVRAVEEDKIET